MKTQIFLRISADQFSWYLGKAHNISKLGIFIETERVFKVGPRVYLNFNLTTDFQNIKTVGDVVWFNNAEGEAIGRESCGMGVRFSLSPSEDLAMRCFTEEFINYSITGLRETSLLPQSEKHILYKVEVKNSLISSV